MTIRNQRKTCGKLIYQSISETERLLLRRLADDYYGTFLVRVIKGIVHNLNGPLQVLYIRSEQLEQGFRQLRDTLQSETLTEAEGLAGRMEEKVKAISTKLDDLNAQLMHLTSDLIVERRSEIETININRVIEDCFFLMNADMFFKHKVKKTLKLDNSLPVLTGRKTDFCIIILNLIQNALEAMTDAQDKNLSLETSRQDDRVIIRFRDTGCGIPEQDREHIYNVSFTTREYAADKGKPGSGLGLSLVCFLLEDYNGTIACESVAGKTTFTVEIPHNK